MLRGENEQQRAQRVKNEDEDSSEDDYERENEINELKDLLTTVLINDLVDDDDEAPVKTLSSTNDNSKVD